MAVCAIVTAIVTDRSLWVTSCALAGATAMPRRTSVPRTAALFIMVSFYRMRSFLECEHLVLTQLAGDFVDARFGAHFVLVTAGCAGNSDRSDDVITDHDGK